MTRRYALRDDQWERIKDLLPGREGTVGVTAKDNRLFVEAVLDCASTKCGINGKIMPTPRSIRHPSPLGGSCP